MLIIKIGKKHDKKWMLEQFEKKIACIKVKDLPHKDMVEEEIIAININNRIYFVGNLQTCHRIGTTRIFRVYITHLFAFKPIPFPMYDQYKFTKTNINKSNRYIKIGSVERNTYKIPTKFRIKISDHALNL